MQIRINLLFIVAISIVLLFILLKQYKNNKKKLIDSKTKIIKDDSVVKLKSFMFRQKLAVAGLVIIIIVFLL